jgi:hypothetical protein
MLLLVTAFALWLGLELQVVRERRDFLKMLHELTEATDRQIEDDPAAVPYTVIFDLNPQGKASIPFWRRWLGDEAVEQVALPLNSSLEDAKFAITIFPEARECPYREMDRGNPPAKPLRTEWASWRRGKVWH